VKQVIARKGRIFFIFALIAFLLPAFVLHAQDAGARVNGNITDAQGKAVVSADVTVTNAKTGATKTAKADNNGAYSIEGLSAGTYNVSASAIGFAGASKTSIVVTAGQTAQVSIALGVSSVMQQIEVNAGVDSIAAQAAPSGGFLDEGSPQSLVSNTYIENFTSPIADFGELVQIVPGAFTTSSNGVGLGQSKTYFRAFADGEYNIDFDGIPYYDTNTPTHHSWAFFPSQWIGGVDFDRSPGTASTIGPTPFGGSMHQFSKPLSNELNIRGTASYGTWNTKLYDAAFNSGNFGLFGGDKKSNLFVDVHRMTSDGYQSFNYNERDAGSLLYQYTFSPRTVLTGFSGVIHLYSNGPNISSSRCMMYGTSATGSYGCTENLYLNGASTPTAVTLPQTGAGIKFLMTNNSDPASWFNFQYNSYVVPTDFEYVGLKTEFGKGWYLEVKPYTYNYDNGEKYSNATPITHATTMAELPGSYLASTSATGKDSLYYLGTAVAPCNVQVVKKGIAALPCGIDKYNSYRKYGEIAQISQTSTFGVFRAGMWYEWARTNRHQYPSDPLNNWADQALSKFNERFWTNSYQPYAEYEFHVTPKFNLTTGVKFAGYTFDILHFADDGSTVGNLGCTSVTAPCPNTITNTGNFTAWLPSLDLNYRVQPNWSFYGQASTGSVVPPSAVYDYNQTAASANAAVPQIAIQPKQQKSSAYQAGTVFKANRVSIDADAYMVRFQSGYSSTTDTVTTDPDYGDTIYYLQPSSTAKGLEFESTVVLAPGLSLYLNGTAGTGYYRGQMNANLANYPANPVYQRVPSGLWVQQTPTDTEAQGLTYGHYGFEAGIFNKRIGEERMDNGQYHNQAIVDPFSTLDTYFNYTIRNHSIFDQTKIRLSATNLMDSHNLQTLTLGNSAVPAGDIPGTCGTTAKPAACVDQFNATTTLGGADLPSIMAGRSFAVTVTFGFAPRR
jgi:iron complex outermembrane receptor protein